jgi:hypothetical protein
VIAFVEPGAVVRVAVEERDKGEAVLVLTGLGEPTTVKLKVSWSRLQAFRDGLAEDLYKAVQDIEDLIQLQNWDDIRKAVNSLANVGSRMMYDLMKKAEEKAFWTFLNDNFPEAFSSEPTESYEPPLIEVDSPGEFIPFGIISPAGATWNIRDGDLRSLRRAMFNFLGMKGIIRHAPLPPEAGETGKSKDNLLWNPKRLPIKFFYDSNLDGAKEEKKFFFDVMAKHIDADGPWPNHLVNEDNVHAKLASALWETGRKLNGDLREVGEWGDQVHHFSCHCDTESEAVSEYSIEVRDGSIGPFRITLNELKPALRDARLADKDDRNTGKPLLFLNACGSAVGSPKNLPAFPQTFAESHRAVIGTEATMPDGVAAIMAERFYLNLLAGSNAGQSLHKAKWHLVDMYYNPLGALYTLHGETGLHISDPKPELAER